MRVLCRACGKGQGNLTKPQAYDLARFEGCPCGGNLSILDPDTIADLRYDIERDKKMIAELEAQGDDAGPQPW